MKVKLLIVLLIIFCSCGRKSNDNKSDAGSVIKIDLLSEPGSKVEKLSEFAVDIDYIPLQTTENSLIGNLRSKIVNIDKRIYIQSNKEILCFDREGKFLFKLENSGRGPQEYVDIIDFDISSDNKTLTILSKNKLLAYKISESDFTFLRSITLKEPAPYRVSMIPETNNAFISIAPWTGTESTLSLMVNTNGDTILFKPNCYKYNMVRERNFFSLNEMIAYTIGDKVCFKEEFSDTVFYVDEKDNSFKPRMILNSHGTLNTPEVRGGTESAENHPNYIANIFETPRYVYCYYISSGPTRNRFLYDKTTKTKYKLDIESKLKDDLGGGPEFDIEFLKKLCSNGNLFLYIEALTLKKYIAGNDFKNVRVKDPKKKDELKKLADSLKETDNPVLVIVTPKE